MRDKWKVYIEWGLILLLFLPIYEMARLRMHHRNLSLFVLLGLLCVTSVILCYYFLGRRMQRKQATPEETLNQPTDDEH